MSKLMIFDFACPEHGSFEDMVQPDIRLAPCPKCGANAPRQISAPRIGLLQMALSSSASPEAINKFERVHRERKAIEEKTFKEHGDYGTHAGSDGGAPVTQEAASAL